MRARPGSHPPRTPFPQPAQPSSRALPGSLRPVRHPPASSTPRPLRPRASALPARPLGSSAPGPPHLSPARPPEPSTGLASGRRRLGPQPYGTRPSVSAQPPGPARRLGLSALAGRRQPPGPRPGPPPRTLGSSFPSSLRQPPGPQPGPPPRPLSFPGPGRPRQPRACRGTHRRCGAA